MQKIDEKKLIKYGSLTHTLSIPKTFVTDNHLDTNDMVEVYRDTINGKDALIIFAKEKSNGKEIGS